MSTGREIRLVESEEGWRAIDQGSGLETRGESRVAALEKLDDVAAVDFETDGDDADDRDADDGSGLATDDELEWFED